MFAFSDAIPYFRLLSLLASSCRKILREIELHLLALELTLAQMTRTESRVASDFVVLCIYLLQYELTDVLVFGQIRDLALHEFLGRLADPGRNRFDSAKATVVRPVLSFAFLAESELTNAEIR